MNRWVLEEAYDWGTHNGYGVATNEVSPIEVVEAFAEELEIELALEVYLIDGCPLSVIKNMSAPSGYSSAKLKARIGFDYIRQAFCDMVDHVEICAPEDVENNEDVHSPNEIHCFIYEEKAVHNFGLLQLMVQIYKQVIKSLGRNLVVGKDSDAIGLRVGLNLNYKFTCETLHSTFL